MDIKVVFATIGVIIGIIGFFPYLRDVLAKKTKPHSFTWLIWALTQGVAVAGMWAGGGDVGAISMTIGTIIIFLIFLLSLKYGYRDISLSDKIILTVALIAIGIWVFLDNPILALLMVTGIDVIGYIPSIRKCFHEPGSETVLAWNAAIAANVFSLLALREYNFMTIGYLVPIFLLNSFFVIFILICRNQLGQKNITIKKESDL